MGEDLPGNGLTAVARPAHNPFRAPVLASIPAARVTAIIYRGERMMKYSQNLFRNHLSRECL
jgi:hypothetical protein